MLVEFVIGRSTSLNPVGALQEAGSGAWRYLGWMFFATGFLILSYYSVVAGWTLRYSLFGITGNYAGSVDAASEQFVGVASGLDAIAFHALFMLVVLVVVGFGIRQGIELAVRVMVPALILVVLGLAAYAVTLGGAGAAYAYYLSPDLGAIAANWTDILPAAAGQAFFTLSLGMGVMITYSSYLGEDRNLALDGGYIVGLDTLFAFAAGLVVFPVFFTAGVDPNTSGAGAIFISLAAALGDLPLGNALGLVFFLTVAVAALTSAISLLEVVVSYLVDNRGVDRMRATVGIGVLIFLLGVPTAVDLIVLDLFDLFANNILLVAGALLLSILVGWIIPEHALDEVGKGIGDLGVWGRTWLWLVRVPVVVTLLVTLALGIAGYYDFLTGDFAEWLEATL
jgi:NSS family neurotransmitter:Na+ symporter